MNLPEGAPLSSEQPQEGPREINREIIFQQGPLVRERIWYEGHSHWRGENIDGYTGPEHVVERTYLRATRIIDFTPEVSVEPQVEEELPPKIVVFRSRQEIQATFPTEVVLPEHVEVSLREASS